MTIHSVIKWMLSLFLTTLFVLHAGGWLSWSFLQRLEYIAYDAKLTLSLPGGIDPRIIIVDIDERSLREEGQWPWSRNRLADLVNVLFDHYQIAVLGFDVVFAEPEPTNEIVKRLAAGSMGSSIQLRAKLARLRYVFDPERRFAAALRDRPVVLGYFFNTQTTSANAQIRFGQLPEPVGTVQDLGVNNSMLVNAAGYGANLKILQDNAQSSGFFNSPLVDQDGLFRRVPLVMRFEDKVYEQLSLAVVRTLLGQPPLEFVMESGYGPDEQNLQLEALHFGGFNVPVDHLGAVFVPYRGVQGSFPYISATDVLNHRADPQLLNGAIALVGTTAAGLLDLRATPVQNIYPGVEINANLIAGFLDQNFRHRPPYIVGLEIVQLVLVGLFSALASLLTPLWALLLTVVALLMLVSFNGYFWQFQGLVVPIASGLTLLLILYVLHTSYNVFIESRRERQLARLFGQYVPHEIVEEMSRKGGSYSLEGESRQMTVLFSDIEGFTSISEQFEPRQLTKLMQFCLTPLTEEIHEQRGTIDKYIGDAIMAFWGAPLNDPEQAWHAVQSALKMVARLKILEDEFRTRGWPPLQIRIGINTGIMSVGNMGSKFRMSYTVLGDAVNLAARLESAAKQYSVPIVISERTRELVPELICRELDWVRVKGREQPVVIFEPLGLAEHLEPALLEELVEYDKALQIFRAGDWQLAEQVFERLLARWPGTRLYEIYLERAAALRAAPPKPGWDSVFSLMSK